MVDRRTREPRSRMFTAENVLEYVFLLILGIVFLYYFFRLTKFNIIWPPHIMEHIRTIVMTLTLVRIVMTRKKITPVEILLMALSVFVFYETFFHIRSGYRNEMLNVFILMIGCINIPYRKIAQTYFVTIFSAFLFTLLNVAMGKIDNVVYYRNVSGLEEIARNSLGMTHHSYPKISFFYMICAYLIIRSIQITYVELGILEIFNVLIFMFGDGRNHFLCVNLLLIGTIWFKIRRKQSLKQNKIYEPSSIFSVICCYSAIIAAGLSFLLGFFYSPKKGWMAAINKLVSGRLYYSKIAYDRVGLSLWGQDLVNESKVLTKTDISQYNFFIVDNQYVRLVIHYGIFCFGIIMLLMYFMHYKAYAQKQWMLLLIFAVNAVQFMIDRDLFMLNGDFLILCAFAAFSSDSAMSNPPGRRGRAMNRDFGKKNEVMADE